ncbi:MAG: U32 family peptidase [Oceanidesulfovibrio sp.]
MTDRQSAAVRAAGGRPEILAPAGDRQAFLAALAAGADAVYIGLKHFSARMQASNFAVKETLALTDLAHERGAKLYLAVNTLLKPDDLGAAGRLLERLSRPGSPSPDAIIAQDLGTLKVARQADFSGELHLSTLAALSPTAGLETAAELGVSRVVLPRELDIEEIKAMAEACPEGMDLEVFIHGALCYAVSGRCYWSTALGGKSGLRGRCVQPCRRVYELGKRKDRFFSCLDLGLDLMVKTLLDVPQVACWKIEGRKKGAHYVFYTTTAYRMLRDEGKDPAIRKEAEAILERALGRPTSRSRFLPQSRQLPLPGPKDAGRTGSGLFIGTVARTPEGTAYLKPRVPLMARDLLRIGSEDEKHHRILKVSKPVPKAGTLDIPAETGAFPKSAPPHKSKSFRDEKRGAGGKSPGRGAKGGKRPFTPRGKVPPSGTPVYLVDRQEPELMERINAMEAEAKKLPEPQSPGESKFTPRLPAPHAGKQPILDMLVRRAPPKGKEAKFRGQLGLWMSPRLIDQVSRTFLPRTWWWLPPVIWPDEEKLWRAVLLRMVKQGARTFVLNAPWQMALLPERRPDGDAKKKTPNWQILAGPFCNISNALALESLAELGFDGAIVSPELGKDDYLALPRQSPLPLGMVTAGFWAACVSRHVPAPVKQREPLTSPKGEVYWPRTLGQNLWLFPSWPVDLSEHRQSLENAGYRWFVTLDETRPKEVPDPGRTTVMNWDGGVL